MWQALEVAGYARARDSPANIDCASLRDTPPKPCWQDNRSNSRPLSAKLDYQRVCEHLLYRVLTIPSCEL